MRRLTEKPMILVMLCFLTTSALLWFMLNRASPPVPTPVWHNQQRLIFAHRGGRSLGPENTIHTFRKALLIGAHVLEFDVRLTRDGHLVVIHDATVDRTTDGNGSIASLDLEEIAGLDAAFYYSTDQGRTFTLRGSGIRAPSLMEVFRKFPQTPMNIELKDKNPAAAQALCRLVTEYGMTRHVLAASFHADVIRHFRNICPDTATAATTVEVSWFFLLSRLHLETLYGPHAAALQIPTEAGGWRLVTTRLIEAAHRRQMRVYVWTVNRPQVKRMLFDLGTDGIMTDTFGKRIKPRREKE